MIGVRIAKPGKSVSDPIVDMSMTSEANSLKIIQEGAWSKAVSSSNTFLVTIAHNLGYTPTFRVQGTGQVSHPEAYYNYPFNQGGGTGMNTSVYADATNLYVQLNCGMATGSGTIYGYYVIFEDSL